MCTCIIKAITAGTQHAMFPVYENGVLVVASDVFLRQVAIASVVANCYARDATSHGGSAFHGIEMQNTAVLYSCSGGRCDAVYPQPHGRTLPLNVQKLSGERCWCSRSPQPHG